VVTKK